MADRLPAGPYRTLRLPDGTAFPWYVIPFDKEGRCTAPGTRQRLIEDARDATHVFLFSHGWNNDWAVATRRYESFLEGFVSLRERYRLPVPAPYRPVLAGVFWPSTALVFGASERGPAMAGGDPVAEERQQVEDLAAALPPERVERFYELAQQDALERDQAVELAEILRGIAGGAEDEIGAGDLPPAEEIVSAVASDDEDAELGDFGTVGAGSATPRAAGGGTFDPRNLVRAFTVFQMKDRAGRVGARGVGPLLRDLLGAGRADVLLIGHSYGGKVVLSALCAGGPLPRPVRGVLLLQPAVSHLCFAQRVPGTDRAGGYRAALDRVEKPILTTFSTHDAPLTRTFHLALRRDADLGEARIAAAGDPPSPHAALGGFGPRGCGERLADIQDPPQPYALDGGARVIGLRGTRTISGHGDVSNESTWWALHTLVAS